MKRRTPGTIAGVTLAHAGLVWLLAQGRISPAPPPPGEPLLFVSMVSAPSVAPAPAAAAVPAAPSPARPQARVAATHTMPAANRSEPPLAMAAPPSPPASAAAQAATAPSPAGVQSSALAAASTRPATASSAAAVVLPSSDADYLHNPPPTYPRMSRRMGEQGTVVLRVFINAEGRAEQADVRNSSGHSRLDEAALETVKRWRYVPGQRAGQAEGMWFNVPVRFLLD